MPTETVAVNGPALGELRRMAGMSKTTLADLAGIDRSWLSKIERGGRCVRVETFQRLLDALAIQDRRALLAPIPADQGPAPRLRVIHGSAA